MKFGKVREHDNNINKIKILYQMKIKVNSSSRGLATVS